MMQYSVYTRFCRNDTDAKKHTNRVVKNAPKVGSIRVLKVTNAQYNNMAILAGEKTDQETVSIESSLLIIE